MDQVISQDDCRGRLKAFVQSLRECQTKAKDLYDPHDCLSTMDFLMKHMMDVVIQNTVLSFKMMQLYVGTHSQLKIQGGKDDVN